MKLILLLPWACCCLCGSALATGFLYPFPAAALQQHGYPEQGAGSPGNGYSSRRHWCHHTVTRTVSCQVQNGSETVVQRVYQSCRWPGPCANLVSYRTLIRPTYRVSYRTVTALEWRCCPGFTGSNCDEGPCIDKSSFLIPKTYSFCGQGSEGSREAPFSPVALQTWVPQHSPPLPGWDEPEAWRLQVKASCRPSGDAGPKVATPVLGAPNPASPRRAPRRESWPSASLPVTESRGSPPPKRAEMPAASARRATHSDWLIGFHDDREQLRRSPGNSASSRVWTGGSTMEAEEDQKKKRKASSTEHILSTLEGLECSGSNLLYFSRSP
ncbi:hypothetical protein NN561_003517 [Cricetulus griseus]